MTYYGQDYMLEDRTGQLDGSDFEDVHDRVRLTLRCTQNAQTHTVYMIYDRTRTAAFNFNYPLAVLDFGPNGRLGTVSFKTGVHTPMKQYLIKVSTTSKVHARKFIAQDGQEYQWSWRIKPGEEWTCTNASGYLVACYSLKLAGEPEYYQSSGCMLTVDEAYPHLLAEMLASLTIMRHIVAYNL
ncbi:hypothetical protein PILCRDRAFT_826645 [Piloderma croceum F 1598]|uniref:Uncharacterized protein n=1 Tax=Piloderma croceum (strain F 1598) TaxID=765440 RepID=A0A0C3F8W3_PILCF|nr:hypothetical protein PILCRDRAFT_826645 [Piloderma croceum F 1598]